MMELGFILLQTPTTEVSIISEVVEYLIGIGITGVAAIVFGWLYFKGRKKVTDVMDKENERLCQEKEHLEERLKEDKINSETQINVLWTELKESKNEDIAKNAVFIQSLTETQLQTVKTLQDNTEVIKVNTKVLGKTMDVLNKVIDLLTKKK